VPAHRRSRWLRPTLLLVVSMLCGVACKHDLAALRDERSATGTPAAGQSSGQAGSGAGSDALASCRPCDAPSAVSSELITPEACCTGPKSAQCGVSLGGGANRCYPRQAPGLLDTSCPDLTRLGTKYAGCCRFDETCGVNIGGFELGCVGREDVPVLLGGPLTQRACLPKCDSDRTCSALVDVTVCVEDASHRADARFCGYACKNDKDCNGLPGRVCALQQNTTELRIDAVCRKPLGVGVFGDPCASPDDCVHAVCLGASQRYCSQLCRTDLDCETAGSQCKTSTVPLPAPAVGTQAFNVCVAKK
jgi:hypothetical protein